MDFFSIAGLLLLYIAACSGVGLLVLRILGVRSTEAGFTPPVVELATVFLLGSGMFVNIWVVAAAMRVFSPLLVGVTVPGMAVAGAIIYQHKFPALFTQIKRIANDFFNENWGWKLIIVLVILSILAWATSLGRRLTGDAAAFYMTIAKLMAHTHQLIKVPTYENFSSIGLQGEMHYAALISLGSIGAAKLFPWPTMLAGAFLLAATASLSGAGRRGQWLVMAMIYTSTAVVYFSGSGKPDPSAASLGLAAYYWIARYMKEPGKAALWLIGFFSGLAVVAKFSYLPLYGIGIPLMLIWGSWDRLRNKKERHLALMELIRGTSIILLGILIAITPHMMKNGVLYSNPIAPIGEKTLGWANQDWLPESAVQIIQSTYPLQLFFGTNFAQLGNLSPIMLIFFPMVLLLPRPAFWQKSTVVALSTTTLISVVIYIAMKPEAFAPRYMLPGLLIFSLPIAIAAESISLKEKHPCILSAAISGTTILIIFTTWLVSYKQYFFPEKTYHYITGEVSECQLNPLICKVIEAVNSDAEPGARILFFTYHRFYLRPDLIQCTDGYDEFSAYLGLDEVEQRWNFIYNRGFRYIIYDSRIESTTRTLNIDGKPEWLTITEIVDSTYRLLKLESQDPARSPGTVCAQVNPFVWKVTTY